MADDSLKKFLQILSTLLTPDQEREVASTLSRHTTDPKSLARELVKRGWLTSYQVQKISQGQAASLVLGPYVLLDLLGEGGMGQVFKARHKVMDRMVALKIIRTDRLTDADVVARFHREIKAAAKLSHPHVVHAYDASQAGNTHFYVMELVTGTDLARVLKDRGPLPVALACEYVRQAALGLQHAHEHGLVHRDIKPANLIRAEPAAKEGQPLIKILDLGLARLRSELSPDQTASDLTRSDSIMGTPDYLAPEQAANPAAVDIRADIYSLGCTLYHLLTGQVPFPGGTLAQKLQWHQELEPAAVESVRRDLPAALGAVIRKMMAKRPADRYQTPAEVAAALEAFCDPAATLSIASKQTTIAAGQTEKPSSASGGGLWWLVGIAAMFLLAGTVVVGIAGILIFLYFRDPHEPDPPPNPNVAGPVIPPVEAKVEVVVQLFGVAVPKDEKGFELLLDNQPMGFDALRKDLKLAIGPHVLVLKQNGVVVEQREFVIVQEQDQQKVVIPEAERKPGQVTALGGHQAEVTGVAFSGDGLRLLSVGPMGFDGVFVWDPFTGKQVHHYPRAKPPVKGFTWSGALSFDGHAAVIGSNHAYKGNSVKPWVQVLGLESGTKRWETHMHTRKVQSVALSQNGKFALSADESGITRVWDAASGAQLHQLPGSVACFSPTASHIVTAQKTHAHLWELAQPPREVRVFKGHSDLIRGLAFSADGKHVLTGGDATLRLWHVAQDKEVQIFKGHAKEVTSVAISPDGRRVLSGSKDMTVRLWNVADGQEIVRFTQHTDVVTSVAYSPGGRRAASGSVNRTVRIWALPR